MSESHQLGQIYPGVGIEKILLTFPLSTTYMEALEVLLYFDETQNVNIFLLSMHRLTSNAQNNYVQNLHYILRFVEVKQQTQYKRDIKFGIFLHNLVGCFLNSESGFALQK